MKRRLAPWWFVALVVIFALPLFSTPMLMAQAPGGDELHYLLLFYPVYLVVAAVCALICYNDRRAVAWVLLVLMALSDVAIWMLATGYGQ